MSKTEQRVYLFIALVLFLGSLIPRFYDILKFLPLYSTDENEIVEFAVSFIGGDLDPHWYKYGPLYAYFLSLIYYFQALLSGMGIDLYMQDIFYNPTSFYYTARFVNSLLNVLLAGLTYMIARRYFGIRVALIALVLAVFPFFDRLVFFKIRVDTLLSVWTTLALFCALELYQDGNKRSYLLTGLFFGLAFATKPLPALLLLPTLLLAHYFRIGDALAPAPVSNVNKKQRKKKKTKRVEKPPSFLTKISESVINLQLWQLFGIALLAAVISNPYSLLNASEFVTEQFQAIQSEGQRAFLPGWDITRFFGQLGIPFVVTSVITIAYFLIRGIREKNKTHLILISFPIIFWLAFARGAARNYFYVPMIPVLIIFSALAISELSTWIENRWGKLFGKSVVVLSFIALLIQPSTSLAGYSRDMNKKSEFAQFHTVFACQQWIEQSIPQRSRILYYGYYTSLPRLVDFDANQQAQYGEYFMYSRWKNEYLKNLFINAHRNYLSEKKPLYDLENIRARIKSQEHLLFNYCLENKIEYLVTYHNLMSQRQLSDRLVQTFTKEEYGFGLDIFVFQITKGQ